MSSKTLNRIMIVFILLIPNTVLADRFTEQVKNQLASMALVLGISDRYKLDDVYVDKLRDDRSDTLTMTLSSSKSYAIVGVCDEDCQDIDLRVYDEDMNLVGKDTASDDKPMVGVSPRWSGKFKVRVIMHNCSVNPCSYGIGLFGKR